MAGMQGKLPKVREWGIWLRLTTCAALVLQIVNSTVPICHSRTGIYKPKLCVQ